MDPVGAYLCRPLRTEGGRRFVFDGYRIPIAWISGDPDKFAIIIHHSTGVAHNTNSVILAC